MVKENVKIRVLKSEVVQSPFTNGYCKKYYVQIKHNNKHFNITFHDSVYNYQNCKKLNKNDVLYSVLSDMNCYEMAKDEQDFLNELGYDDNNFYNYFYDVEFEGQEIKNIINYLYEFNEAKDVDLFKQGLKAYEACKKTSKNMHELFTKEELEELQTEFENY